LPPELRQPLLVELHDTGWTTQPLAATASAEDILALKEAGLSGRDIAKELGLSKSEVYRRLASMKDGGHA
jgi:DNA-binding IclR family transcriptional regulator